MMTMAILPSKAGLSMSMINEYVVKICFRKAFNHL